MLNELLTELCERHPKIAVVLLVILGAGITTVALCTRAANQVPSQSSLVGTEGIVTYLGNPTRFSNNLVFKLDASPTEYSYIDWHPHFEYVSSVLHVGKNAKVFTLPNENMIWQLEIGEETVVPYEDYVRARTRNNGFALGLAIAMPILVIVGLVQLLREASKNRLGKSRRNIGDLSGPSPRTE